MNLSESQVEISIAEIGQGSSSRRFRFQFETGDLSILLKSLLRGSRVLIAGPPGSGKTVFAQQLTKRFLARDGEGVAVVSGDAAWDAALGDSVLRVPPEGAGCALGSRRIVVDSISSPHLAAGIAFQWHLRRVHGLATFATPSEEVALERFDRLAQHIGLSCSIPRALEVFDYIVWLSSTSAGLRYAEVAPLAHLRG